MAYCIKSFRSVWEGILENNNKYIFLVLMVGKSRYTIDLNVRSLFQRSTSATKTFNNTITPMHCHKRMYEEEFENTKGVIRICKSKDRQRSTKHYTENKRSSSTNYTKTRGWTRVLRKDKLWHPSYQMLPQKLTICANSPVNDL